MSPNLRVDDGDVQRVWSKQRRQFIRVDEDLRCGSRHLASLLAFIKHKYSEEFEVFVEGCDISEVDAFSDILPSTLSADRLEEKVNEKEKTGCSKKTTSSTTDGVNEVVLKEPPASSCSSVGVPSSGVENTDIETHQSAKAVRTVEQRQLNVDHSVCDANPVVPQTSTVPQTSANSKTQSGGKQKATDLGIPSLSPSSIRLTRLQKKKQLENDCKTETPNSQHSSKLTVTLKLPLLQKRRDIDKRRISNRNFRKVGQREGKCADSLASRGTSVDSGSSEDALQPVQPGGETKRKKAAVPNLKKRAGMTCQKMRMDSTSDLKCPICKKTFTTKGTLKQHKQIHNPEKNFKCLLCPKAFHQKVQLQYHQNTHTNEKPFKCSFCPKKFNHPTTRRRHELIHRNLKPLKCPFCSESFRHSNTFLSHKLLCRNEKRYACFVCPKTFRTASQLNRHEQIHRFE